MARTTGVRGSPRISPLLSSALLSSPLLTNISLACLASSFRIFSVLLIRLQLDQLDQDRDADGGRKLEGGTLDENEQNPHLIILLPPRTRINPC